MALTIREKEHWKSSIERRIQRSIDHLYKQGTPDLHFRIEELSKQKAIDSLGISKEIARRDQIQASLVELEAEKRDLEKRLTDKLKAECVEVRNSYYDTIGEAVRLRQKQFRAELLAQDPQGQRILKLEQDKEDLFDTVWLATSPSQMKELWSRVSILLGEPPTGLQKEALDIPVEPSPSED